jgi:integrase
LWEQDRLGVKPRRSWREAVVQYLQETRHKATHEADIAKLRYLDRYLGELALHEIKRDVIDRIAYTKAKEASEPTANRYLALIRAVLRRAAYEWEWIERPPRVRLFPERKRRVRYLTPEQEDALLRALPGHQSDMAQFALATGLRQANVKGLEWSQVDMQRHVAWVHPDQAKGGKGICVPLNKIACQVVLRQLGKHPRFVFTYQGRPVKAINTKAWKKALRAIGLEDFRWHDLRHAWATRHVQAGTSTAELQELGGWQSPEMVRRYAHFSADHLAKAAARIEPPDTKMATPEEQERARRR